MLTKYYDLMGYTGNPYYAEQFARFLSSYWSHVIKNDDNIKNPIFDFIVTPKRGSPILGYEFAKLIQKPFVIHDD